jgi:hypothetical protein
MKYKYHIKPESWGRVWLGLAVAGVVVLLAAYVDHYGLISRESLGL